MSDDLYGDDAEVLEISEDAVRAWVTAWREFADVLNRQSEWAQAQSRLGESWGDLESIQFLERTYREHLGGAQPDSFSSRIKQFSVEAELIAEQLESQYLALRDQDFRTAQAMDSGER